MKCSYYLAILAVTLTTNSFADQLYYNTPAYTTPQPTPANYSYSSPPSYSSSSSTSIYQLNSRLTRLESDVSQLKSKVSRQSDSLARIERKLNTTAATTLPAPYPSPEFTPAASNYERYPSQIAFPPASSSLNTEQDHYNQAYQMLRAGNVDSAIAGFQDFIRTYPSSSLADNAQYWLGEAYLKQGDKIKAMETFDRVKNYPDGNKVPDALLKIGVTQLSLGDRNGANNYFNYVIAQYPNTAAANQARDRKYQAGLYN